MALPLDSITVVEFGQNLAGPFCAEILGHMSADVIKVERPGAGDDARGWGPPCGHGTSAAFHSMNCNKRGIAVDLKDRAEVARLRRLIGTADVVVQNMRPGAMEEVFWAVPEAKTSNSWLLTSGGDGFGLSVFRGEGPQPRPAARRRSPVSRD